MMVNKNELVTSEGTPLSGAGENEPNKFVMYQPKSRLDKHNEARKTTQLLGAAIAMLGSFSLGLAIGWSSPAIEIFIEFNQTTYYIKRKESSIDLLDQTALIASFMPLGAICVMFPIAYSVDNMGRKLTMLSMAPLVSASFLIVGLSLNFYALLVGRFIMGFSTAGFCVTGPIYLSEIAEESLRGTLLFFFHLLVVVGIVVQYLLGHAYDMVVLGCISACFPAIFMCSFIFIPESPIYLIMDDEKGYARESLEWYRGKDYNMTDEWQEIVKNTEESKIKKITFNYLYATGTTRKSLLMLTFLMVFQQVTGVYVVLFYATDLFRDSGSYLTPMQSASCIGIAQIVGAVATCFVVEKIGRKLLLYISHIGMFVCLCAHGGWFIYVSSNEPSGNILFVPIVTLCLYILFYSIGSGPVPWTILGEVFPPALKGRCAAIVGFVHWGFAFINVIIFQYCKSYTPLYVPYFVYAAFCVLGVIFFYFFVIETKGKTMDEIQEGILN